MGAAEMSIRVGADVQGAVSGLNQLATSTAKTTAALGKLPNVSNQATQSLTNLSRVAQDAPYGFIGIANNINPLLESFQRLKATTGSTGGALKALGKELTGAGGLGLAVGIVSSLLVVFGDKIFGAGKKSKEAADGANAFQDAVKGIFSEISKEATQVGSLITVLKSETETRERRLSSIKELQKIQPEIFKGLKLEGDAVIGLDTAYKNYLDNLKNVISAKIIQAKIEQKINDLLIKQGIGADINVKKLQQSVRDFQLSKVPTDDKAGLKSFFDNQDRIAAEGVASLEKQIQDLFTQLGQFSSAIKVPGLKLNAENATINKIDISDITDASVEQVAEQIKDGILGAKAFNFIKIPIKKVGYTLESPGSAAGNADSSDDFIERQIQNMNALGDTITGFVTPAFDAMFATIAKGGNVFKAFGQAIIQSLVQVISKLITTVALAAILSAVTGGAAGLGFKGMSGFKNIFSGLMGFRAGGGPVSSGMPYMVGENGPEMFYPETSGRIQPAGSGRVSQGNLSGLMGNVVFSISGNNLIGVFANANRSQSRLV